LVSAIGAYEASQIEGFGGGTSLTSKVAIVSKSAQPGCDVDYLFAQVGTADQTVDTRPNCGNMLAGVGPFALENGLVAATGDSTVVRIYNVNTSAKVHATIQTPGGRVNYDGDTLIDGVTQPAAPVHLTFLDAWGAMTGKLFPTGNRLDVIDGVEMTCIDAAMQMMIVRASHFGLKGTETAAELDATSGLIAALEALRRQAGLRMGLGDVSHSVIPKPVLVSPAFDTSGQPDPRAIVSRYFTPKKCHTSHAVTGAIGIATALALPGTVASGGLQTLGMNELRVYHPSGVIQIAGRMEQVTSDQGTERATELATELAITQASVIRTVRKIMRGELSIPSHVFL
jgi:2-methylaconitate cis-trans-isomerase PrpF